MFVRNPYNYDNDVVSHRTGLDCSEFPSRTQQHFRDETDINVLVSRFVRTGVPEAPPAPPMAAFERVFDFQSAMQAVVDARVSFQAMPSSVRSRFNNDPGLFLSFIHDPSNRDEAVKLGLVPPPVVEPVVESPPPSE